MESDIYDFDSPLNQLELKKLFLTIEHIYEKNYYKNLLEFYNLLKIRVLKQVIFENKYFMTYKKLYALRNIIFYFSLKLYGKINFKKASFNSWYNNTKIYKVKEISFKNTEYFQKKREAYLRKIILNKILKSAKLKYDDKIPQKYFLLLMKYFMYLFDKYYIRSIITAKALYNYVRKKLKEIKAQFFNRIDFNLTEEDIMNVYKYILINYNKVENNDKKKKEIASSLIAVYNKTIKHNYDILIKKLFKQNNIYVILFRGIFNKILINKDISLLFSIWKQKTLNESLIINFQLKEKYTNNLVFSKIYMFTLVIKKIIKKYFELFYNNIYKKQTNGLILIDSSQLLSIFNFESLYNNYMANVLKGLYKIQNYKNIYNSRIFQMNDMNKKKIALYVWTKKNKKLIFNYFSNNTKIFYKNIKIIKGSSIFDKIYYLFYNKRISNKINSLLMSFSSNENIKTIFIKFHIFLDILNKFILYKRKKIIFNFIFGTFRLSEDERILKNEFSYLFKLIKNIFLIKYLQYKTFFFHKLKYLNITNNLKNSNNINFAINNFSNKQNKIKDKKLVALNKILKYFLHNSITNNFPYSLKNAFNNWSLLIGYFPRIIKETQNNDNSYMIYSEDEEDIITQRNEINELHKCLQEDKDFQHDLKAKITALDEENEFICEKIFEITQRVEKCEKCSNLLKSSNISDNLIRSSKGSMIKSISGKNNNVIKSRNMLPAEATFSSGLNFNSGGTDLVPKKPKGSLNHYEVISDPGSEQMEDIDENNEGSNDMPQPYLIGLKQKILDLKQEKEPIVNKLKEEITALYLELNMTQ